MSKKHKINEENLTGEKTVKKGFKHRISSMRQNMDWDKTKSYITKRNIVIGVALVIFLVQYIQMQSVLGTFSFLAGRDSSLVTEIGQLKEVTLKIGNDLNEVRDYLRLPTGDYAFKVEALANDEEEDKNQDDVQLALFKYIDFLGGDSVLKQRISNNLGLLNEIKEDSDFAQFLRKNKLKISEITEDQEAYTLALSDNSKRVLISFILDKTTGELKMETLSENDLIDSKNGEEFLSGLTSFITKNQAVLEADLDKIEKVSEVLAKTMASKEVLEKATELELKIDEKATDTGLEINYGIYNQLGELVGEVALKKIGAGIFLRDMKDKTIEVQSTDVKTSILPFIEKLDFKTPMEKKADEALDSLTKTISDQGFRLLLEQNNMRIDSEVRDDGKRFFYDIYDESDKLLSSLAIEKATGVINIVDENGANSENLLFFSPEVKKKTLNLPKVVPKYGDQLKSDNNSFNILIAGKHGSLVDTMIFAHIDETTHQIRMISIPRDLFYNGRKINSLAFYYGMPELKKVLSELTGYKLDKFILIDMYAFIDVIDLIGGIDITLKNAVIDPTYRTVDNGVEGTLHYEPGSYHLGGKESLRLARSRHTSSDFARATRQQKILQALQNKARNFGFGDADTIYKMGKTILKKTETDVNIDEAIAYFFRYQNYEIVSNNVMSSGNVLYVPPYITKENCEAAIAEALAAGQPRPGCENENQAYALLPRDDNWDIIKWFFRDNFED